MPRRTAPSTSATPHPASAGAAERGRGQPRVVRGRGEPGVGSRRGDQQMIIELGPEVRRLRVGDDTAWVVGGGHEAAYEIVDAEGFGTGDLHRGAQRRTGD